MKHISLIMLFGWMVFFNTTIASGNPIAREPVTGNAVEIINDLKSGHVVTTLPIHGSDTIWYFAAGVGLDERRATYPQYPVKLIFSLEGGPYVSLVSVVVRDPNGDALLTIPSSHTTGPWLFLNLPDGRYQIDAIKGENMETKWNVHVQAGQQIALHYIFP